MGGTGGRAHTGQWTLEARVSGRLPGAEGVQTGRESELSSKVCAREQGQCARRLLSGMKCGSGGLGVAWPRAKVQETEASTRFS